MTNEEAIKYLKQLYPICADMWPAEQRIEAIDVAIEALSKQAEQDNKPCKKEAWDEDRIKEPTHSKVTKTSEQDSELEEEITKIYKSHIDLMMTRSQFSTLVYHFIDWQKQQMMKSSIGGVVCFGSKGVYVESNWLGTTDVETYGDNGSKVRIIVLKEK